MGEKIGANPAGKVAVLPLIQNVLEDRKSVV